MGARRQSRRDEGHHYYSETSRWVLSVAVKYDNLLGQTFKMARWTLRCAERTVGSLQGIRPEVWRLYLTVGSQPSALRDARVQSRLQRSMARNTYPIWPIMSIVPR